jgi:uncharacterized protein (DUF608 family)
MNEAPKKMNKIRKKRKKQNIQPYPVYLRFPRGRGKPPRSEVRSKEVEVEVKAKLYLPIQNQDF